MKITLRDTADLLNKYQHIALTAHVNPDGDAVGSLLALAHYLKGIGKKVTCVIDDDIPENFQFMPGYEAIVKPDLCEAGADLLVILDASDMERIGKVKDLSAAAVLNIDHHLSNGDFAQYTYVDSALAATGEIIFQLLKLMRAEITPAMATCLYTAIATDCGFFRFSNTSVFTMQCAAECIELGVRPNLISEALEKKPLSNIHALSKALDTLEIFCDGKISCMTITPDILELSENTEGFIDFARTVDGVDLAILIKHKSDGCRVSMRSKFLDVSALALQFGGGGHARAAGCTIKQPLDEAKALILHAARQMMEETSHA